MPVNTIDLKESIRRKAASLGFCATGFATVVDLEEAGRRLREMIDENRHGELSWLAEETEERQNPAVLMEGAGTVVSLAISYHSVPKHRADWPRIARYAMATDYHRVIAGKLQELLDFIRAETGIAVNGRICVDSSPLFEKEWAKHAGIGSIGKNGLLIVPLAGSFVFLGELLLDMAIEPDQPSVTETCGSCTACLDHCPTGALLEPGKLDVSKCLSYLTVELKRDFTAEEASSTGEWIFGCDICQEVCPRNQEPSVSGAAEFATRSELQELSIEAILALTKSGFRRLFLETPIYRSGLRRLKRNALAAKANIRRSAEDDPADR